MENMAKGENDHNFKCSQFCAQTTATITSIGNGNVAQALNVNNFPLINNKWSNVRSPSNHPLKALLESFMSNV